MQSALFYPPLIAWVALSLCLLLSPLQAQDLHITLLNGDCDGDNEVTLFDFGIVVNAFGSTPNDPNWDPRADLDGDCEVTLFDYGIVVRNFDAVGAEPFDPALPRQPAPSEGYALQGSIELEGWVGAEQPVRIEALREDDPDQTVYWMDVQSSTPFTLHLPQSGLWEIRVSGAPNNQARTLVGQVAAKRMYLRGDPIQAFIVMPREGEAYAAANIEPMAIGVSVYAYDYDSVYFFSANRDEMLANRERSTSGDLWFIWEVNPGDGNILPPIFPWSSQAIYIPPTLNPGEQERTVTLRCTVVDVSPDWSRRDQPVTVTRSIRIVNRPTVHLSVYAVDDQGSGISSTPIPSGQLLPSRLRFTAYKRGTSWNLESVTFDTPWGTYSVAPPYGESFVSFTIPALPPDESHRRFEFGASAVFSIILPPPVGRIEQRDEKRMESLLGVDMTDRLSFNEVIDPSRGHWIYWDEGRDAWVYEPFPVPNWFHNRSGHWGNVIPRFNEEYTYGGASYPIVHWFENEELTDRMGNYIASVMDWSGDFADVVGPDQGGNRWTEPYRGRIYLSKRLITHAAELRNETYGLVADGIDLVARVVAHEFFHRDQFLAAWGGFSDAHIGPLTLPDPTFWPGDPNSGYDNDGDGLRNTYEEQMQNIYHTNPADRYAVLKWWTGKQIAAGPDEYYFDWEMCARLWGEWNGYWVGSLDSQDWSVGGRQDYEGGS